jgi:ubiquinone/menaquinone biosynthesis C-methylase UbiE
MKPVIDNFSSGAADYAAFRPESPKEVFDFLYSNVNSFDAAWDCGTGNGQVAAVLAERFGKVYATDISTEQLARAIQKDNIIYLAERSELTSLPDHSVDLVTCAQALHWFDFDKYFAEVRRVAKPNALVAAWTYNILTISKEIDGVISELYTDITGPYWNPQRKYIDENYTTIPFDFKEIKTPDFQIVKQISLKQLLGYLRTWSGVVNYIKAHSTDSVSMIEERLTKAWGTNELQSVKWPVYMRAGRV